MIEDTCEPFGYMGTSAQWRIPFNVIKTILMIIKYSEQSDITRVCPITNYASSLDPEC